MIGRLIAVAGFALVSTTAFAGGGNYHPPGYSAGAPHTSGYSHKKFVRDCGHCDDGYYHKPKVRVETSIARAGLGGDSIVRANNDSRTTPVFYVYTD
ncbi:MAG: hypothetical protein AAF615_01695 [Pseudomonadota bacterium]